MADEDADEDSVTIGFTAYRSAGSYVQGELILEIEEGGGSSSATIVYTVDTDDSVAFSPYLRSLREAIRDDTKQKIADAQKTE